jgi:hypothetical protein
MHDHLDTKRVRHPILTANVQQQLYMVIPAALKVVNFGLLSGQTLVQSQDVDKSSYRSPVSEYLDMPCDSLIVNSLTPELNLSAQRCLTRFLLRILLLAPCISLIYALKTNKYTHSVQI